MPRTAGWSVYADASVHVVPDDDMVDHDLTDCVCVPTSEPVVRDDGSMGWVEIHHSLDGREQGE